MTVAWTYINYQVGPKLEWEIKMRGELLAVSEEVDCYALFASIDYRPI